MSRATRRLVPAWSVLRCLMGCNSRSRMMEWGCQQSCAPAWDSSRCANARQRWADHVMLGQRQDKAHVCWSSFPCQRSESMEPLRVLIAEDHPLFRKGMRALLTATPGTEVVGEATTGQEAIELATELQPDVILMDLQMPGINGIEATRQILHTSPHIRILVVTLFEDNASIFTALRAGARGYILKDAKEEEMLRAIRAVGSGEAIFSPAIATRLMDFFAAPRPAVPKEIFPTLTEREREILQLIARGRTNNDIAKELALSTKTVVNYVSNIFIKLQVADRAQANIRERDAGLMSQFTIPSLTRGTTIMSFHIQNRSSRSVTAASLVTLSPFASL